MSYLNITAALFLFILASWVEVYDTDFYLVESTGVFLILIITASVLMFSGMALLLEER